LLNTPTVRINGALEFGRSRALTTSYLREAAR